MKRRHSLIGLLLIAIIWPLWLPWLGLGLVVRHELAPADAIVPLAGGHDRVRYAATLVYAGYAPLLVTSDIVARPPSGRLSSWYNQQVALEEGIQPSQIVATDRIVTSTYSELQAIRALAERKQWRNLIIVSSPEHTRRSALIAAHVFRDSPIRVIIHPVEGYAYNPARWWEEPAERRLTLLEYPKIALLLLGYRR